MEGPWGAQAHIPMAAWPEPGPSECLRLPTLLRGPGPGQWAIRSTAPVLPCTAPRLGHAVAPGSSGRPRWPYGLWGVDGLGGSPCPPNAAVPGLPCDGHCLAGVGLDPRIPLGDRARRGPGEWEKSVPTETWPPGRCWQVPVELHTLVTGHSLSRCETWDQLGGGDSEPRAGHVGGRGS